MQRIKSYGLAGTLSYIITGQAKPATLDERRFKSFGDIDG